MRYREVVSACSMVLSNANFLKSVYRVFFWGWDYPLMDLLVFVYRLFAFA